MTASVDSCMDISFETLVSRVIESRPSNIDLVQRRERLDRAVEQWPLPDMIVSEALRLGDRPCERLRVVNDIKPGCVIYLHGGGFCSGSLRSHRHLAGAIAGVSEREVIQLDYRLAPEHPYPAAVDDVVAAVHDLERELGASRIALVGDSAGANLALAAAVQRQQRNAAPLAALVCLSPVVDLSFSAPSHRNNRARDPLVRIDEDGDALAARHYRGDLAPTHPGVSPLFADLRGLPTTLIHVGADEVLLDDAQMLGAALTRADVPNRLKVWSDVVHVWHWYWPIFAAGREAIEDVAAFLDTVLGGPQR